MTQWFPFSTAPEDRKIICRENSYPNRVKVCEYHEEIPMRSNRWVSKGGGILLPTHWDEWTEYDEIIETTKW